MEWGMFERLSPRSNIRDFGWVLLGTVKIIWEKDHQLISTVECERRLGIDEWWTYIDGRFEFRDKSNRKRIVFATIWKLIMV